MIDILMTTYNRAEFLKRTLDSLFQKTKDVPYRLFIIDDCSSDETPEYLSKLSHENLCHISLSKKRRGVRYGFNLLWTEAEWHDIFYEDFPYLCYFQDDVEIMEDGWLATLLEAYEELKEKYNIGFFSGYDCVEHPVLESIDRSGRKVLIKISQGFPNVVAEKSFWRSVGHVPRFNPDGHLIGFPDNGRGSNLDVWFMGCYSRSRFDKGAASPDCSFNQGKKVMVIPMMRHLGQLENSTWDPKRKADCLNARSF
jgi:glycosyltransferase involved in cell wall biosynthesis